MAERRRACLPARAATGTFAYADAHSNLAETLVYLGRYHEARLHWAAYLDLDPHSSWAAAIRELLENLPTENG